LIEPKDRHEYDDKTALLIIALDAIKRGFSTTVLARATRPVDAADGESARAAVADAGGRVE
jgi:hypothetical protein